MRSRRCSSFFAKSHARLACSVVYALATARCRYQLFASCGFFIFFAFFVVESLDMQFVCVAFYVYVLVLAFKMHLFSQYPLCRSKLCIACFDFFAKVRARSRRRTGERPDGCGGRRITTDTEKAACFYMPLFLLLPSDCLLKVNVAYIQVNFYI